MPHFDLLQEGWIPCVMLGGSNAQELNLKETLVRACEIQELSDPSPLVTLALHRLLLAVLHRVFGPKDTGDWALLWNNGWDNARLEEYFARESVRDRFNLFDDEHPFYQTGDLDFKYEKPIANLAHQMASGGNPMALFDHTQDCCLRPAEAARYLIAFQSYAVEGLLSFENPADRSADAAPLVKGASVLVRGEDLFRTLMLNLHQYNAEEREPFEVSGEDLPAWEQDEPTRAEDRHPAGYLDLLTWQSRRVRLLPPESDGEPVRSVVIMKGRQFPTLGYRHGKETMLAFRCVQKAAKGQDPWPAVGFREDRVVWRDSLALFQAVEGRHTPPKMLTWLADLVSVEALPRSLTLPLELFGLCTDQAKVMLWRHEHLPLPVDYLGKDELVDALGKGLDLAEKGEAALRQSARTMAGLILAPDSDRPEGRQPKAELVSALATRLLPGRSYWAQLETPFHRLLVRLPTDVIHHDGIDTYGTAALREWAQTIRRAALDAFESSAGGLGISNASAKATARAESRLRGKLRRALADYLDEEQTDQNKEEGG
ncbi:MAG: type I-E CRISPR-associated protein Cse1/CasA [Chloroflexi bacterium]|nr:type I-E CRISPR-associated protein Cse1/CasA [Chloroflexota bacterium]